MKEKIAVIGSGSWGVALAILLNTNGHEVKLWSYSQEEADIINNDKKCKFLPEVTMPEGLSCYTSLEEALDGTEIIVMVTPSSAIRATLNNMKPFIKENQIFVLASKGMEKDSQKVYTEVIKEIFPNNIVGAISGPSHAEEVSIGIPTAVVISSEDDQTSERLQNASKNIFLQILTECC